MLVSCDHRVDRSSRVGSNRWCCLCSRSPRLEDSPSHSREDLQACLFHLVLPSMGWMRPTPTRKGQGLHAPCQRMTSLGHTLKGTPKVDVWASPDPVKSTQKMSHCLLTTARSLAPSGVRECRSGQMALGSDHPVAHSLDVTELPDVSQSHRLPESSLLA